MAFLLGYHIKLAALIGLLVGFPQVALLITFVLGGAVGSGLLLARLKRTPLAPFLTLD
ncbi:hypothetical protein M1N58_03220 [Dehalococcoidales bacterium]|nr:hypothetical protein [Dehalococcoidales bacterium]